jgi:hypothetical protein
MSPYIKRLMVELSLDESTAYDKWHTAKAFVCNKYSIDEGEMNSTHYNDAFNEVVKGILPQEELINVDIFLSSDLPAKAFIETMTSASVAGDVKTPLVVSPSAKEPEQESKQEPEPMSSEVFTSSDFDEGDEIPLDIFDGIDV